MCKNLVRAIKFPQLAKTASLLTKDREPFGTFIGQGYVKKLNTYDPCSFLANTSIKSPCGKRVSSDLNKGFRSKDLI